MKLHVRFKNSSPYVCHIASSGNVLYLNPFTQLKYIDEHVKAVTQRLCQTHHIDAKEIDVEVHYEDLRKISIKNEQNLVGSAQTNCN